jgi:methionine synthase II (cobalamin-independent)
MSKKNEIQTLEKINLENIFQNFLNLLNNEIKDLRSLEILTVSAENLLIEIEKHDNNNNSTTERISLLKDLELFKDEQKVKILARTHYELDGDIIQFLPMKKNQENTNSKELRENAEIITIHNQNVERALKNQQDFIKIMTGFVSQVLIGITGTNGLKGLGNLIDTFVTDKNKT